MTYYRIKKEYDNAVKQRKTKTGKIIVDDIYIEGELYTEKEMQKHVKTHILPAKLEKMTEIITIPKTKTCFIFGARFEIKGE